MPKFVPRQRKHKVLARQKAAGDDGSAGPSANDPNASQIVPLTKDAKEVKRQRLREELRVNQPKISAKKKKRLDKYIENKLKKEENLELVRKLEAEKDKFDPQSLRSSKNLRKRGFDEFVGGQIGGTLGYGVIDEKQNIKRERGYVDNQDDDELASEDSFEADHQEAFDDKMAPNPDEAWAAARAAPVQGSGLAKPLQLGPDGLPILQIRSKRRGQKDNLNTLSEPAAETMVDELPWEGFQSESELDAVAQNSSQDESESEGVNEPSSDEDRGIESLDSDELSEKDPASDDDDSDTDTSSTSQENVQIKPRASAFKAWATQQLNQAVGHTPSYAANGDGEFLPSIKSQDASIGKPAVPKVEIKLVNGLPELKTATHDRTIYSVQVSRAETIQSSRAQLPILQREQEIMEAIHANPVVVIKGDTGSGKTTQIPQFLFESGYGDPDGPTPGMIGITQPRRVAAVSMAKRVGEELGDHGNRVAHQIRFDSSATPKTAIKFMTDGILLRELAQDLLLTKYSAIIIDEAHERSVNTDILIGMLSKIVPARMRKDKFNPDPKPLKLIIMSATLNIGDFLHAKLFSANMRPPVVEAEGRQHRVTTHFALRSRADYLEETIEKVKRAHRKLPKGGILVFLTGQNEIRQVQHRLKKELAQSNESTSSSTASSKMHIAARDVPFEIEDFDFETVSKRNFDDDDEINILTQSDEEAEDREFDISDDEEEELQQPETHNNNTAPRQDKRDPYDTVHILPLYSQLPTKEQLRVFDPPPDRSRLIVLATNVAETSLTIPGIRYVFDSGRSKERKYDLGSGIQSFEIDYISKASAQQRAGRAGRTGPGHCWRLYSSAVYEQFFPDHTEPEILRTPAESVVLQIKGFAYPKPVIEFPFPTAPTLTTLDRAEKLLRHLGALSITGQVTDLGKEVSLYPISPRLGKILTSASKNGGVVLQAISLVAGLAVGDIYINNAAATMQDEETDQDEVDHRKQNYGRAQATLSKHDKSSDAMKLLTAVSMYNEASDKEEFCNSYFLKPKAMGEISKLVQQLGSIVTANHSSVTKASATRSKLSSSRVKAITLTAASGYIDQVAIRWDCAPNPPSLPSKPRRAIDVPYLPLIPLSPASSDLASQAVFIHPSSVLSRSSTKDLPQYIIYTHLQQSQTKTVGADPVSKTRMYPLTPIDGPSLAQLAKTTTLIQYGKPIPKMKVEDLPGSPKQRICWVSVELRGAGAGSYGWPLPAMKVQQVLDVKSSTGWRVEEVLT